jgi:hypothetical protein
LDPDHLSHLWWTASFTPAWILSIAGAGEIDLSTGADSYRAVGMTITPAPTFNFGFGHTYLRGGAVTYSAAANWSLPPRWAVHGTVSYDFRQELFQNARVDIVRDLHDLAVTFRVSYDPTQDDLRAMVLVEPKIFR